MPRCGNRKTQSPGSVGAGGRAGRSVGRSWCPPRSGGNPLTRTGLKQGRRFLLDPVPVFPKWYPRVLPLPASPRSLFISYCPPGIATPRRAAQSGLPTGLAPLQSAVREWQVPAAHRHPPPPPHPHPAKAPSISHHCCEQAHSERTISARAQSPPSGRRPSLLASGHCRGFLSGGFYSGHQSSFW